MTGTGDTLTISWGAIMFRLEGFGAAPGALHALGAYFVERASTDLGGDGAPPLPDPATLARLVGWDIARRVTVEAEGSAVVLRLGPAAEPDRAPPESIRVVKAPRAEVEAAREAGLLGATDAQEAGAPVKPAEGALSPEDEAALQRDLDSVEVACRSVSPRPAARPLAPGGDARETARLLARTDSRLSETTQRQRSSAHQHLRAAAAANRAEEATGRGPGAGRDDTPYRDDLAAAQNATGPLRLDPSQRLDRPSSASSPNGERNFRDFAEKVGAIELPDRLEAAAAWLADAEGQASFPRVTLLETVREADGRHPPLDEALQACAHMLRAGRLRAAEGGRLAPTETTRFRDFVDDPAGQAETGS